MSWKLNLLFLALLGLALGGVAAYQRATVLAYPHGLPPQPQVPYFAQVLIVATIAYAALWLWIQSKRS